MKKAIYRPAKKLLALKEINFTEDKIKQRTIFAELRTLLDCKHPNIIKSYGAFQTENGISIALEYMNAGSLAKTL